MGLALNAKMKINKPASVVYDAFVNPDRIKNFWFSKSSDVWVSGRIITLGYEEYVAEFDIEIVLTELDRKIVFNWGQGNEIRTNTITFDVISEGMTLVEVVEEGWNEDNNDLLAELLQNQTGWVYMLTCLKAYLENGVSTLRTGLVI